MGLPNTEALVKKQIKDYLKSLGAECFYFMPVPTGYGIRGIPDFIGCYKGKFFAVEAKAPGKEPNPWQVGVEKLIRAAGGLYTVAWSNTEVKSMLEP